MGARRGVGEGSGLRRGGNSSAGMSGGGVGRGGSLRRLQVVLGSDGAGW